MSRQRLEMWINSITLDVRSQDKLAAASSIHLVSLGGGGIVEDEHSQLTLPVYPNPARRPCQIFTDIYQIGLNLVQICVQVCPSKLNQLWPLAAVALLASGPDLH